MKTRSPLSVIACFAFIALKLACAAELQLPLLNQYVETMRGRGEKMNFDEFEKSLSLSSNATLIVITNSVQQFGVLPGPFTNIDLLPIIAPSRVELIWKMDSYPWAALSNSLSQSAKPLAALHEAAKTPDRNAGYRTYFLQPTTPYRLVRRVSEWLNAQVLWNLHEGHQAQAVAGVQTIAGLSNLHREEYLLVSQLSRIAVARLGLYLTWQILLAKDCTDDELRALNDCWTQADYLEGVERGLEGERCIGRESIEKSFREDPASQQSYYSRFFLDGDLLFQIRHVDNYVGQIRALRANHPWSEVSGALDQLNAKVEQLTNDPQHYVLSSIAIPNFKRAVYTATKAETERRMTLVVIAVYRYQSKYHEAPSSLGKLVPDFLPAIPCDCMSGQPFLYRLDSKDSFTLYSVGLNGKDDGGDSAVVPTADDVGLWKGRDFVWPTVKN